MVSRRTVQGVDIVDDTVENGVDGGNAGAGRKQRDFVRVLADGGQFTGVAKADLGELLDLLNVRLGDGG